MKHVAKGPVPDLLYESLHDLQATEDTSKGPEVFMTSKITAGLEESVEV